MAQGMPGVDIAERAKQADAQRWHDIEVDGFLQPTDDAILTYHVSAVREKDVPHHAVVSGGYVRRNGDWKMMFHQQTPLPDTKKPRGKGART